MFHERGAEATGQREEWLLGRIAHSYIGLSCSFERLRACRSDPVRNDSPFANYGHIPTHHRQRLG